MIVRLNRQYQHWTPGSIVELGDGICAELLRRGVAVIVHDKLIESAPKNKAIIRTKAKR